MLILVWLLADEPQVSVPPPGFRPPVPEARLIDPTPEGCRNPALRTQVPTGFGPLGVGRAEDVSHYLLLERRIDGCPVPIIVNQRVPGSNAVGRQLGLDPPPGPRP